MVQDCDPFPDIGGTITQQSDTQLHNDKEVKLKKVI
jgi:hypothetical protein